MLQLCEQAEQYTQAGTTTNFSFYHWSDYPCQRMGSVLLNCPSVVRLSFFSMLVVLALSIATTPQCTPASSRALDREIASLQSQLDVSPNDPVLLYNLAADYAAKCDSANTLALLHKVASSDGGLDPAQYRGFAFVRDSEEFKAIVAQIRAKNPPRVQSHTVFVIKEAESFSGRHGLRPIQRSCVCRECTAKNRLDKQERHGARLSKTRRRRSGIRCGIARRRKAETAVGSELALRGCCPRRSDMVQGLFVYDLVTGKRITTFVSPDKTGGYLNDVTVAPSSGDAYTTNTDNGAVYIARRGSRELQIFLPAGTVPGSQWNRAQR